jgi:hypothetical protein
VEEKMFFEYKISLGLIAPSGMVFVLAPLGGLVMACLSEVSGTFKKKIFLDKFAWQLSRMTMIVSLGLVLSVVLMGTAYSFLNLPLPEFKKESQQLLLFCGASLGLSAMLQFLYLSLWKKLKKSKLIHLLLGASALVCYKLFLIGLIFIAYFQGAPDVALPHFFIAGLPLPAPGSLIYPLGFQMLVLSVAAGASLALLYLLLRRNQDDFGRDYYRYVIKLLARWLIFSVCFHFLPCFWVYFLLGKQLLVPALYLTGTIIAISTVLLIISGIVLLKSKQPLRLKGVMACCFLLVWLLFAARLVSYFELANVSLGKEYFRTFVQKGWL